MQKAASSAHSHLWQSHDMTVHIPGQLQLFPVSNLTFLLQLLACGKSLDVRSDPVEHF